MCHYFIKATGGKGTIINAVSLGASFLFPGMSSYSISKLAMIKLGEYLDLGERHYVYLLCFQTDNIWQSTQISKSSPSIPEW